MPFYSKNAVKIWDVLYTANIPDQLTLDRNYVKRFGVHVTQNKEIDSMLRDNFITVKIPIIRILEYFNEGIQIQIHSRKDLVDIHRSIEDYLQEWREYLNTSIHATTDIENNKELISSLEKLSKYIYDRLSAKEAISTTIVNKRPELGLINPIQKYINDNKVVEKPNYDSIMDLVKNKNKKPIGRF